MKCFRGIFIALWALGLQVYGSPQKRAFGPCSDPVQSLLSPSAPVFQYYSKTIDAISFRERKLYTMFAPHVGYYEMSNVLVALDQTDSWAVLNSLDELLDERYPLEIENQMAIAKELVSLAKSKDIRWMGTEANPQLENETPLSVMNKQLWKRFSSNPQWNETKQQRLLHLLYNSYIIVRHNHPDIFTEVRSVFLGDPSLEKQVAEFISESMVMDVRNLMRFVCSHQGIDVSKCGIAFISNAQKRKILSQVREREGEEVAELAKKYIDLSNKIVAINKKRDEAFARNIMAQEEHGISILGSLHKEPVQQHIQRLAVD